MRAICAWVERFGEIVRGLDALAHVAVWDRLFSLTCPRPGGIAGADGLPPPLPRGERPQIMAALGGLSLPLSDTHGQPPLLPRGARPQIRAPCGVINIALWEIKGNPAGLPVWRVLGGEPRPI